MSRSIQVHTNRAERSDEADVRPLGEIMQTRVVTIGPKESATAAWTRMRRRGIRHLVVTDHDRLVGVVSERDLGGRDGANLRQGRSVRDLMSRRVLRADPNTTLREAADQMRARLIGSLPVVEGERLVGIVTATDVFDALGPDGKGPLSGAERQLLRSPTSSKSLGDRTIAPSSSRHQRAAARAQRVSQRHKREPFAAYVPRPAKRHAGRTTEVPANVRLFGAKLDDDERLYIKKKLGTKLGKFARSIERVTVRLDDVNGPRGGVDQHCRVKVVLSGRRSVIFESRAAAVRDAVNGALTGAERGVRRLVRRASSRKARADD